MADTEVIDPCGHCGEHVASWTPWRDLPMAAFAMNDEGAGVALGPEHAFHVCTDLPRELQALALRLAGEWFAAVKAHTEVSV